jgi:hypothetical protein
MFQSVKDSVYLFDSCADWVQHGENYEFTDAPGIILHPFEWFPSGDVSFAIIRSKDGNGEIVNRFTFEAFPGMDTLRSIAVAYFETDGGRR